MLKQVQLLSLAFVFYLFIVHHCLRSNGLRTIIIRGLRLSGLGKYIRLVNCMLFYHHDSRYGDLQNQQHIWFLCSSKYFIL